MQFTNMKKNSEIYTKLWSNLDESKYKIIKTIFRGSPSDSSFSFDNNGDFSKENHERVLVDTFGIENKDLFHEKFNMAVSGVGSENRRILTLLSSSLCALLFFYSCSIYPITISLNDNTTATFSKVFFEWKNKVLNTDSNIDVVLYSPESNILLFLESKFSEYITSCANTLTISYKYSKDPISGTVFNKFSNYGYKCNSAKEVNDFTITSDRKHYIKGLKQMVCHYIGLVNFLNIIKESPNDNFYLKNNIIKPNPMCYLGEILFDKGLDKIEMNKNHKTYFDDYAEQYRNIASILQGYTINNGIKNLKILPELLTYSMFDKNNGIEPNIKEFYFKQ